MPFINDTLAVLSALGDKADNLGLKVTKSIIDFNRNLKSLEKSLMTLKAKASDIEEQIKFPEGSRQKKRKREVEVWLRQAESVEDEVVGLQNQAERQDVFTKFVEGGTITRLNEVVVVLIERTQHFNELMLDACGTRGVTLLIPTRVVGEAFEQNFQRILTLLGRGDVSIIGIYGMGGVGKTLLAKRINNHFVEGESRVRVLWITVSQGTTTESLQDKIARFVGVDLMDEDDGDLRAARLHAALSQPDMKDSVLILDDVWEDIDVFKVGYPVSLGNCRVIITTRSLQVCRQIHCQEVIRVEKLCEEEAWTLFSETLGNEVEPGGQVEQVARCVAKLCDGLPLGIITLARSMRGEISTHTWANALVELKVRVRRKDILGQVSEVLKHSFDLLNKNDSDDGEGNELNASQLCFLYCSLYPENYDISRGDLVREFISEGLLDERKSRASQVDQGHSILDALVNVSLLEISGDKCVRMHDLVRVMALSTSGGKYMVRGGDEPLMEIPKEGEWTEDLEKVSLMRNEIRAIEAGTSPYCPHLSTLLLRDNPLMAIPDSFLSRMQRLSTLDLCRTHITMLPDSVSDLISLNSLLLEGCQRLQTVPSLGKLVALRDLNLSDTAIKQVPQGVEELCNLKFLSMDAPNLEGLRKGLLLKLGRLQYVKFPVQIHETENLKHLEHLEQFCGGLKNVRAFNCFVKSWRRDAFYKVQVGLSNSDEEEEGEEESSGLRCREVTLSKCNLREKVMGEGIEGLTIKECEGMRRCLSNDFSPSSYLKSLKRLRIQRCGGTECISTSDQEQQPLYSSKLECIKLEALEDFKEVFRQPSATPPPSAFHCLKMLVISGCDKMAKLGLPALGLPKLEEITISGCGEMEAMFDDEDNDGVAPLPNLRQLSLIRMPKLCKAKMKCSSIKVIKIQECPMLRELPLHLDARPPTSLEEITISGCGEMEVMFDDEDNDGVAPLLPNLRQLSLIRMPRLRKAKMICSSIKVIKIQECPMLRELPLHLDAPPPTSLEAINVETGWWNSLGPVHASLTQLVTPL